MEVKKKSKSTSFVNDYVFNDNTFDFYQDFYKIIRQYLLMVLDNFLIRNFENLIFDFDGTSVTFRLTGLFKGKSFVFSQENYSILNYRDVTGL